MDELKIKIGLEKQVSRANAMGRTNELVTGTRGEILGFVKHKTAFLRIKLGKTQTKFPFFVTYTS